MTLSFVCLRDHLILDFLLQQFETGNRWIELASTITLVLQANRLTNSDARLLKSVTKQIQGIGKQGDIVITPKMW